jgi:hypothetical protein
LFSSRADLAGLSILILQRRHRTDHREYGNPYNVRDFHRLLAVIDPIQQI